MAKQAEIAPPEQDEDGVYYDEDDFYDEFEDADDDLDHRDTQADLSANAVPVTFERVNKAQVARDNWSSQLREPLNITIGDAQTTVNPVPGTVLKDYDSPLYALDLDIGGRTVEGYVPTAVISRIIEKIDPSLNFDSLDMGARTALLEFATEDFLEDIERKAAFEISLKNVMPYAGKKAVDPAFIFDVNHPAYGEFPFGLDCDRTLANRIRKVFDKNKPQGKTRRDIAVTVSFRVGHTTIDLSDLYDLGIGDGIILDTCTYDENAIYAVVNEQLIGRCKISPKGPQSKGHILNKPKTIEEKFIMSDPATDQDDADPSEVGNLGELPVTLVFEVGRIEMELGELETMGEGHIFDLGKSQAHLVDIMTGGRVIGSGEIVRVGDSFGVRVKSFARP